MNKLIKVIAVIMACLFMFTACKTTVNNDKKDETAPTETTTDKTEETSTDAESEDEAWKKEPAYGKAIKIGYNGGLCTGGPGLASALGMFKDEGIETEIVK